MPAVRKEKRAGRDARAPRGTPQKTALAKARPNTRIMNPHVEEPRIRKRCWQEVHGRELSALIYPLDDVLDALSSGPPAEAMHELSFHKYDQEELIFGFHELFQALLTDLPVPEGEHPGYQEAMAAELLQQMLELVEPKYLSEAIDDFDAEPNADPGSARRAAWTSNLALCHHPGTTENLADRLRLDVSDPEAHLSPQLTRDEWESLLVTDGLFDALLWDTDWRLEVMLDKPEYATEEARQLLGYDLQTAQRLFPHPTPEELDAATRYLRDLGRMIGPC